MICFLFKPKKHRIWRARYRLNAEDKIKDVSLGTSDKQVAKKRLNDLVQETQLEEAGLIPPKSIRQGAAESLAKHIEDYIRDLTRLGRDDEYIYNQEHLIERLMRECNWKLPKDVTAESFRSWREAQAKAPKTLNEYLNSISAMLNWMVDDNRLLFNPLHRVKRIEINGKTRRKRRALTDDEVMRLLNAARQWRPVYLCAILTGLRRGELEQLIWGHVFLDSPQPFILVPEDVAKNRTEDIVWLHPDVAAVLCAIRPKMAQPNDLVFPKMPRMEDHHREILKKAGIEYKDAMGRQADFHSLRYVFDTNLARAGVPERVRMALMRHKTLRLTTQVYTDVSQLPTAAAIQRLPGFSKLGSQELSTTLSEEPRLVEGRTTGE